MKLMKKLIQNVRVKPDHAQRLKDKAFTLSMKKGDFLRESEIIHFLIDEYLEELDFVDGKLVGKVSKWNKSTLLKIVYSRHIPTPESRARGAARTSGSGLTDGRRETQKRCLKFIDWTDDWQCPVPKRHSGKMKGCFVVSIGEVRFAAFRGFEWAMPKNWVESPYPCGASMSFFDILVCQINISTHCANYVTG